MQLASVCASFAAAFRFCPVFSLSLHTLYYDLGGFHVAIVRINACRQIPIVVLNENGHPFIEPRAKHRQYPTLSPMENGSVESGTCQITSLYLNPISLSRVDRIHTTWMCICMYVHTSLDTSPPTCPYRIEKVDVGGRVCPWLEECKIVNLRWQKDHYVLYLHTYDCYIYNNTGYPCAIAIRSPTMYGLYYTYIYIINSLSVIADNFTTINLCLLIDYCWIGDCFVLGSNFQW